MNLKLLWTLLFIVWCPTVADESKNHWITSNSDDVPTLCAHDGFQSGSSCLCRADFTGPYCTLRKCRNYGFDANSLLGINKCICPSGFLGRNCEPVHCVDGYSSVFKQRNEEKAISVLVSYNTMMKDSWDQSSDITKLICSSTGYNRVFNFNGVAINLISTKTEDECNNLVDSVKGISFDNCDPYEMEEFDIKKSACVTLDAQSILDTVEDSPPNSVVFVATNMKVNNTNDDISRKIIATAIARRIQINVIVYQNTLYFLPDALSDPGFLFLQNIATSTLGNYIFHDFNDDKNQYQNVKSLLDLWKDDIGIAAVSNQNGLPFFSSEDVYISAQLDMDKSLTVDGVSNDKLQLVTNGTDYWKLYKIEQADLPPKLMISGQASSTFAIVYTKDRLKVYSAFTSDEDDQRVDASYPTITVGTSYELVIHVESNNQVLNASDLSNAVIVQSNNGLSSSGMFRRFGCSFNVGFQKSFCTKPGTALQMVFTNDHRAGINPIYCSELKDAVQKYNNLESEMFDSSQSLIEQTSSKDLACGVESTEVEKYDGRTFVIVSQSQKDSNQTISSVDNLFLNENSILYQLSSYYSNKPSHLSNFVAVFYNSSTTSEVKRDNDYGKFLTKLIDYTSGLASVPQPYDSYNDQINLVDLLTKTLSYEEQYSDIILVLNTHFLVDDQSFPYELVDSSRSRLFIVLLETAVQYSFDEYRLVNDLAARSGGVAFKLNTYDELRQYFDVYFPLLVDNDVIAKGYSENIRPGILLDGIGLQSRTYSLLITNKDSEGQGSVDADVTVFNDGNNAAVSLLNTFGELQIYQVTVAASGVYQIRIALQGSAQLINAVLLDGTNNGEYISMAFINSANAMKSSIEYNAGRFTPIFSSSFELGDLSNLTITESVSMQPFKAVYSGSVNVNRCGYKTYKYSVDFDWVCSTINGLYQIKVDAVNAKNEIITRVFPYTCAGSGDGHCLNGGSTTENGCSCKLGWSGDSCQTPVCQNGGTITSGNTCDCPENFNGEFCETSVNECHSNGIRPDYRSDVSSLIIVADNVALGQVSLENGYDWPGIPISVVIHGDEDARIVLTSTDGKLLPDLFKPYSNLPTADPSSSSTPSTNSLPTTLYSALNVALSSQVTDRALILVITSNPNVEIDSDVLNSLAAQRVELRVLSTSTELLGSNTIQLALVGNGVPGYVDGDGLQKYFDKYINPLFMNLDSQMVFNVFATDIINGTTSINIPVNEAGEINFVHVVNGYISGRPTAVEVSSNYFIYANRGTNFELELNEGAESLIYSVERLDYLKTAYGFNSDLSSTSEILKTGVTYNISNVISIYSPTFANSDSSYTPYLKYRQISDNLGEFTTQMLTKKHSSCSYQYFAVLPVCQNQTTGYQVQLITGSPDSKEKQQQFTLVCFKTINKNGTTLCGGYGSPKITCDCDPGKDWTGIKCDEPTCQNGGVRDGTVCRCPIPYYGYSCRKQWFETPTTSPALQTTSSFNTQSTATSQPSSTLTPSQNRLVAFVVDLVGKDDYAYNQTIQAAIEYVKAFSQVHFVMFTSNVENLGVPLGFLQFDSADEFASKIGTYYSLRDSTKTPSLTIGLQTVLRAYQSHVNSYGGGKQLSTNIFYLTQVGLSENDTPSSVSGLEMFVKGSVVSSPFAQSADQSIMTSLQPFSTIEKNVNDYYNGTLFMISNTAENSNAIPPPNPYRSCAFGLQTNIIMGIDRSSTTDDEINGKLYNFLFALRAAFNYIDNDENRCSDTNGLPDFYNERAVLSSFIYYDNIIKSSQSCPSNYPVAMNYTIGGSNPSATYSSRQVKFMGKYINDDTCICNRYSDTKTTKFVIWLPRSKCQSTEELEGYLKINTTNAAHFVVPFYDFDADKDNDLYYQILKGNENTEFDPDFYVLPNAADKSNTVDQLITALLSKLCQFGGINPTPIPSQSRYYDGSQHMFSEF